MEEVKIHNSEPNRLDHDYFQSSLEAVRIEINDGIDKFLNRLIDSSFEGEQYSITETWYECVKFSYHGMIYFPHHRIFHPDFAKIASFLRILPRTLQESRNTKLANAPSVLKRNRALAAMGPNGIPLNNVRLKKIYESLNSFINRPIPLMTVEQRNQHVERTKADARDAVRIIIEPVITAINEYLEALYLEAERNQDTHRPLTRIETLKKTETDRDRIKSLSEMIDAVRASKGATIESEQIHGEVAVEMPASIAMGVDLVSVNMDIRAKLKCYFSEVEPDSEKRLTVLSDPRFLSAYDQFMEAAIQYSNYMSEAFNSGQISTSRTFEAISEEEHQFRDTIEHLYLSFIAVHKDKFRAAESIQISPIGDTQKRAIDLAMRMGILKHRAS